MQCLIFLYIYKETTSPLPYVGLDKIGVIFACGEIHSGRSGGQSLTGGNILGAATVTRQLRKMRKSKAVKAVVLRVDSPGGSPFASDAIRREVEMLVKTKPVIISMSNLGASGGYQLSLSASKILVLPQTITGSIGVIFARPKVTGLMQKIGVDVEVNKSGADKDMGSPFRPTSAEEDKIFQAQTDRLGSRFVDLVARHRKLDPEVVTQIASARVYLGDEAMALGLVDEVGYIENAVDHAKKLAGLADDAKIVVYRRTEYPDDNIYNTATQYDGGKLSLISMDLPGALNQIQTGFHYLWPAALAEER